MVISNPSHKLIAILFTTMLLVLMQTNSAFAASVPTKSLKPHENVHRTAVKNAGPSYPCDVLHIGNLAVDPATGELWKCQCINEVTSQGNQVICQWRLVVSNPRQSTWINLNSSLFMDVEKVSTADGARVHQWTYTGANNQFWSMNNPTDAYLTAINVNSGKCLAVNGGSTNQGATVFQWGCNGHSDQIWAWTWTGYYTSDNWPIWNIINANSGMCLGIQGGSTQLGANAVQWPCNGNADQKWW